MPFEIKEFAPNDYDAVIALWTSADGVTLRGADARGPLTAYLEHNPGLSFVALDDGHLVGAVLCGTDGRRGYLQHLAVAPSHRRRGIGRELANRCVEALSARGIDKCHLMVVTENTEGAAFLARAGWVRRNDVFLMSHTASGALNA